jgi:hypothetical protein
MIIRLPGAVSLICDPLPPGTISYPRLITCLTIAPADTDQAAADSPNQGMIGLEPIGTRMCVTVLPSKNPCYPWGIRCHSPWRRSGFALPPWICELRRLRARSKEASAVYAGAVRRTEPAASLPACASNASHAPESRIMPATVPPSVAKHVAQHHPSNGTSALPTRMTAAAVLALC